MREFEVEKLSRKFNVIRKDLNVFLLYINNVKIYMLLLEK